MAEGKFVSYCRVSTARQGASGLGLEAQQHAIRQYLNGGGWQLVSQFVEVESGRKNARPELARALTACRVHKAVLVIAKIDRLARNASFLLSLRDAGIEFIAVDMPNANRLTVGILAMVAEDEAERISARTKAALAAKVLRDGQWDRRAKHHLVAGAGQAAATARRVAQADQRAHDLGATVAELKASGITTLRGLGLALGEAGITGPSGGGWSPMAVSRLLARLEATTST